MNKLFTQARKAGIALLGIVAQGVALGLLPERYQLWGGVIIALATALGVYGTPNELTDAQRAAVRQQVAQARRSGS